MKTIDECIEEQLNAHPFTIREVLGIQNDERREALKAMIYGAITRYTLSQIKRKEELKK